MCSSSLHNLKPPRTQKSRRNELPMDTCWCLSLGTCTNEVLMATSTTTTTTTTSTGHRGNQALTKQSSNELYS